MTVFTSYLLGGGAGAGRAGSLESGEHQVLCQRGAVQDPCGSDTQVGYWAGAV